nr:unnamed protein product [Callosobruchus analis]
MSNTLLPKHDYIMAASFNRLKSKCPAIKTAKTPCEENFNMAKTGFVLPRRIWKTANRIRANHGVCKDSLYKWGKSSDPMCDCGRENQTVQHIVMNCERTAYPVRRTRALLKKFRKLQQNPNLPLPNDIPTLRRNRLRSRQPSLWKAEQLVNNNVETVDLWIQNCQLIEDPEVREWFEKYDCVTTGTDLDRVLWVKLNRIRSGYARCADSLYKWGLTDSPGCECGASRQTIKHI